MELSSFPRKSHGTAVHFIESNLVGLGAGVGIKFIHAPKQADLGRALHQAETRQRASKPWSHRGVPEALGNLLAIRQSPVLHLDLSGFHWWLTTPVLVDVQIKSLQGRKRKVTRGNILGREGAPKGKLRGGNIAI